MLPTIVFDFFVFIISIKVDSNSLFMYMFNSRQGLYERSIAICKRVPPAEDSVGVNSVELFSCLDCF